MRERRRPWLSRDTTSLKPDSVVVFLEVWGGGEPVKEVDDGFRGSDRSWPKDTKVDLCGSGRRMVVAMV